MDIVSPQNNLIDDIISYEFKNSDTFYFLVSATLIYVLMLDVSRLG